MSISSSGSMKYVKTLSRTFSSEISKQEYFLKHTAIIPKQQIDLSRFMRIFIFLLFIILSILVDVDNGVIASSSQIIKKDLKLNDSQFGLFASVPFIGRIIGLIIFMGIISSNHRKLCLVLTMVLHGLFFNFFYFYSNFYILIGLRILTSIMKVYGTIYIPVWIDQFGIRKYKTLFFTLIYMTSPYGQVLGFYFGTFLFHDEWKSALNWIGAYLLILSTIFSFIPSKYFSTKYMFIGYEDKEQLVVTGKKKRISLFGLDKSTQDKNEKKSVSIILCNLFSNRIYIFSSITRGITFFIFQIIHNFFKDYSINSLKIKNEKQILYFYGFASLFGPASGSLLGGLICTKLGGYESKNSIIVPIIFGIFANVSIFLLTHITNFNAFSISLFAFFFSSGAILPTIAGYIISSVKKEEKAIGSGFDMLITTLLGKLPGPIIYGLLNDYFKSHDNKLAWKITLCYFYIGFIFMLMACYSVGSKEDEQKTILKKKHKMSDKVYAEIGNNNFDMVYAQKAYPQLRFSEQQEMDTFNNSSFNN